MSSIKKEETEGNVKTANRKKGRRKKYKRSIISGASMSTPSKFIYPVITRSKAKLLNQLKDKHLKSDLLNMNNQFSLSKKRKKRKRIDLMVKRNEVTPIIIDNEMEINSVDNIESSIFPSTSSQQNFSHFNCSIVSDTIKETKDIFTNVTPEKMEIAENFASTSTGLGSVLQVLSVNEELSKINNEQIESNFNENNSEQTILLAQQSNDQFPLNVCENEMENLTTVENAKKDIGGLLTEEIWKTKELYHLQEDIVRMENRKLDTFKRIFKKLYENLFFKNKPNI